MDRRKRNLVSIGLLTVIATLLFVWGLYWLLGTPVLRSGMDLTVELSDGGGLKRSDPVRVQGVQVGTVTRVRLAPPRGVLVDLRLDEEIALPTDTRALVTGDVFGAHIVQLVPGESSEMLTSNDTIRGGAMRELTTIATDLSSRVEAVLGSADRLLSPDAVDDVHATAAILPEGARELRAAFVELRAASAALRRTAEGVEGAEAGPAVRAALEEVEQSARALTAAAGRMDESLVSFASIMSKIDAGDGTLGRLVNDEGAWDEFNNTLREIRALAVDMRERPGRYVNIRIF